MAEVPNLKRYIQRMAGSKGNAEVFNVPVDLLGAGFNVNLQFSQVGAGVSDFMNVYYPQIADKVGELLDANPEMTEDDALVDAMDAVLVPVVWSTDVLLWRVASVLAEMPTNVDSGPL